MAQPTQPAASPRYGLVAVAAIALALYFATAAGTAAASAAQTHGGPLAPTLNKPRAAEEIWEEEIWEEEGFEEGEAEEAEEGSEESASSASAECNLYATTARLVASDRGDTVRLAVRYETSEATKVVVKYWLKGARGSFQLKPLRRHMSTQGTIQGVEHLSDREMAKVRAARVFVVHLEIAGAPRHCERYSTRRLAVRTQTGDRTTWSEPPLGTQPVR